MFKYTTTTLKKIEQLFKEGGYLIRYERGNFHAGYCILEKKKVAVVNKFYDLEARINCLVDIMAQVELNTEQISPETLAYMKLFQSEIDSRREDFKKEKALKPIAEQIDGEPLATSAETPIEETSVEMSTEQSTEASAEGIESAQTAQ